jgi:hypothetical protein
MIFMILESVAVFHRENRRESEYVNLYTSI